MNIAQTKDIIFDFWQCDITHEHLMINNDPGQICETVKYLGLTIDYKLS